MSTVFDGSRKKLNSFTLSRQKEPIIIKSAIDTRKVMEATPEKKTPKLTFWGLSQKKDYATFDLQPPPSVFLLSELPAGTKYFSGKLKQKGDDTHTHTHIINNCAIRCFGLKTSVYGKKWPLTNACRWTKKQSLQQGLKSCLNLSLVTYHCYKIWISLNPNLTTWRGFCGRDFSGWATQLKT